MAEYTIDKIEYNGDTFNLSPNVVYATCPTAAGTAAKVATITSGTLTSLNAGDQVIVKFTYANGKASPTLKVGSTDAKSIMRYGTTAPGTSAASSWNAGSCVLFVYDGTYWQQIGFLNSTYTVTDKKLEIGAVTSGTTYYPIVGNGTTAATRQYDSTGFEYEVFTGTTEAQGGAGIRLGNNTATGTAGNKQGFITIYGTGSNSSTLYGPSGGSSSYNVWLPNNGGILALTTDIPDVSGKIDTAGTGLSKSGTTLNHSNGVTAQTTQAVYPIKIDAQGHISAYGSAVTIPTVPANIVNTITTTAGAHTAITNATGAVSFKVPTTAAHVGAATSDHTHGNITSGGDITATAPTIASGDQIIINDNSASKITNGPTFDGSTTTTALTPKGTWETFSKFSGSYNDLTDKPTIPTDTNTTYALSGALSSHKFTSTLTAGGSGSGTSTSDFTLAAGTGITITDDTSNRKMTIACSVTNTDTKVSTAAITSEVSYYPVLGSDTTAAATKFYDKTGFGYTSRIGTASTEGTAVIVLGNNISTGTAGNKSGRLLLYGKNSYTASILTADLTAHTTIKFPNKSGTIALTSDLSDYIPKPSNSADANYDWVLSNGNGWVPTSAFQVSVTPNFDIQGNPDGTYTCGNYPSIRDAYFEGRTLELHIDLSSSLTVSGFTSNILTDYCFKEMLYPDESDYYYIIEFTGVIREIGINQKRITCRIYLDENEGVYTNGEVTVDIREIGERIQQLGGTTYTTNVPTTGSLAANAWRTLASMELSPGRWVITARARFVPSASGNHYSSICISTDSTLEANRDRRFGSGTIACQHSTCIILGLDNPATVYLRGAGSVQGVWERDTASALLFDAIRIS